ncbi:MAG: hypothetical protein IT372_23630 [Polyangiaceae bacterium]|nr:hypothetical protein [Polyangiaceae bacterium]
MLTTPETTKLQQALAEDARDYYFCGILSLVDALRGPPAGLYTWSTVKLYYSVFYALRAILALHGRCVFYIGQSCYLIEAQPGSAPRRGQSSTHKAVLDSFRAAIPSHWLLTQQIDYEDPLDWLVSRREEANYRHARFSEPEPPPHFEQAHRCGVRRLVGMYLDPKNALLAFDADHAIISFPLAVVGYAKRELIARGLTPLSETAASALAANCVDSSGPLDRMIRFFKS